MIAKHGYIDKQYRYFVIVSLELYCRTEVSVLGSGLYLKVRINWRSQQHDLLIDSFALATSMCTARRETICVYGHIIISCSLCTTRVITILFLYFLTLPSLHPLTTFFLGTYSVHFCTWSDPYLLVFARAPPASTPADLRALEPQLSMKRECT